MLCAEAATAAASRAFAAVNRRMSWGLMTKEEQQKSVV